MSGGVAIKWSAYIPHEPEVKQLAFLLSGSLEALYGGAAGGGKTDALLMGALQFADTPGYSALLLRRTYPDLAKADSLIPRSHAWLTGKGPVWNEMKHQWTFPSGAKLEFGHLQRSNDVHHYQSAAYQYIGFDELTSFEEAQYRYMMSRLRKLESSTVPLRMRSGSNPGGVGHSWVTRRFLTEGKKTGRLFVPATLDDNPYLDKASYEEALSQLDPVTYAQLRWGDWSARRAGAMFKREWIEIVSELPAQTYRRVRYWDMAASEPKKGRDPDWTVGALTALGADGRWYVEDIQRVQALPGDTEALVAATAEQDGRIPVRMEQEPGSSGKTVIDHFRRRILAGHDFDGIFSSGTKLTRAMPTSGAAKAGNLKLVSGPWNGDLLDELESQPGGSHDDQMDAVSGAMSFLRPTKGFAEFHQTTESVQNDLERRRIEKTMRTSPVRGRFDDDKRYALTEVF